MSNKKIRVLIVDDSLFARKIVSDIFKSAPDIEVAGTAVNGLDGIEKAIALKPDVITLDVEMPELNGLGTLKRIMSEQPTAVIMLSSLTVAGARESFAALRYGAVDLMAKPLGSHSIGLSAMRDELIDKVRAAAKIDVARLKPMNSSPPPPIKTATTPLRSRAMPVVIIASSTGGPRALRTVIPGLTTEAGVSYIVVQHLPEGFSGPLASDLNKLTQLNVREAVEGDQLRPGDLIFAKAGSHCVVEKGGMISLTKAPPLWGVRPSADITMVSAAPLFTSRLIGVVLTGMGQDGANGIRLIKQSGGQTLAEHESTCVVYGMPRSAFETGCVDQVVPLDKMADAINSVVASYATKRTSSAAA